MLILFVVFIVKQEIRPIIHKLQARVGDVTIRNQNDVSSGGQLLEVKRQLCPD